MQELVHVENKIKCLVSCIVALEGHLNSRPSDVAEQTRLDGLIQFVTVSLPNPIAESLFSELGRVEGQLRSLDENPEPHAGGITGILEDLRDVIFNYQVRPPLEGYHRFLHKRQMVLEEDVYDLQRNEIVSSVLFVFK